VATLDAGESREIPLDLAGSHGWYDLKCEADGQIWRLAGHIEDGQASFSDPAGGGPGALRWA
jgi:phospholipase C